MDSSDMKNNILFITVTYVLMPYGARAQSGSTYNDSSTGNQNIAYSNLDPTVAIIMIVLFSVLFLMVFISIYIRQCSESVAAPATHHPSYAARTAPLGTASGGGSCYCHRGLDPAVSNSFPVLAYMSLNELESGRLPDSISECAVCLGEFKELDSLKQLPKCNHAFHPKCIDAWLASHVTCPVCRANLEPKLEPDSCPRCGSITNRGNNSGSSSNSNDNTVVTNLVLNESNLQQQQQQQQPQPSVSIVVNSSNDVVLDLGNSSSRSSSNNESRGLVEAPPLGGGGGGSGGDNTNESFFRKNGGLIRH